MVCEMDFSTIYSGILDKCESSKEICHLMQNVSECGTIPILIFEYVIGLDPKRSGSNLM